MSLADRISAPDTRRGRGVSSTNRAVRHSPYSRPSSQLPTDGNWVHDKFAEVNDDIPKGAGALASRISSGTPGGGAKLLQRALEGSGSGNGRPGSGPRMSSGSSLSIKGASAPASTTLEVRELLIGTTPEDVKAIFSECGEITNAWSLPSGNPETTVIRVQFTDRESMRKAIQQFDQQQADGRVLSVKEVAVNKAAQKDAMDVEEEPAAPKGVNVTINLQILSIILSQMAETPFLDIAIGNKDQFASDEAAYQKACSLLKKNAAIYGLPGLPEELSEEQQQIVRELEPSELLFTPPRPLLVGRLTFALDPAPGLAKTRANFTSLCKGDKGMCKNAPNKPLHFKEAPIHRIVRGFIAQGGDITRGDGSGGESIYGAKFADAKEGLKNKFKFGSLGMANSGKNSNTSQFFVTLTEDPATLTKLDGKYVCFGEVKNVDGEGRQVLLRLNDAASPNSDKPSEPVWVSDCGVL
ncbi:hypothetical protein FRB99_001421 [Tulasnella sp. 403]|nr:hypothetical protein FRB99_001421 [Tulasnella sp. 403]